MSTPDAPTPGIFAKYRKAVAVILVTVATFVSSVLTGGISAQEWVLIAGVAVSATGVALVPELDAGIGQIAKTLVTFLTAGLTVLATVILGGLTAPEVIEVVVAALASIGVTALPNDWPRASLTGYPSR